MGLNVSKGNMYEFVTHTWNTVKGECPHECSYCYMKRLGKLKPVRFDKRELRTDLGSGNFIFVGSSCDMFAETIQSGWIYDTLARCYNFDNKYLFQSKNPERMARNKGSIPLGSVVCTTIESNIWYPEIMRNSPPIRSRVEGMKNLWEFRRFVTIEPILDFDLDPFVEIIKACEPHQVNIGADSGNNNLPEPTIEKIRTLVDRISKFTVVSNKRNLERLTKGETR